MAPSSMPLAAVRVVDRLTFLWVEDLDYHAHNTSRGVELAHLVPAGHICELADQIFVGVAQDVGADGLVAERDRGEALDNVLEQLVSELLLVTPVRGAEHAVECVRAGTLNIPHGIEERGANDRNFLILPFQVPVVSVKSIQRHGPVHHLAERGIAAAPDHQYTCKAGHLSQASLLHFCHLVEFETLCFACAGQFWQ